MTRFNNKYPYTDFHELNADWLLETVKDAAAEAQEASDTVATYNNRLTTVEGDLAPIKAAMPGLASDVSDLQHDTGIIDSLITNTINPAIDTLKNEVETPTTGLLDRVSALENQPAPTANAVYYLEFDSSLVSIDPDNAYDSRIEYDWLKQFVPLNVSGEDTHVIKLYDSHTQKVYDLTAFHLQESASPDGKFVFTNRAEHLTGGVVDYYVDSTVTVLQNGTNPTFTDIVDNMGSLTNEIPFDTSFTDANFRYVKNDNMVTLYAVFPINGSISSGALMGHIPAEIQPPSYAVGMLINPNNGNNVPFYIDGATFNMYNLSSLSPGAWVLTATYYTAN